MLLLWLLSACTQSDAESMEHYAPGLRPEFVSLLPELSHLPEYEMDVWFQPRQNQLTGRMRVTGVNTSADIWHQVVFRLYPNLYHYGGRMRIRRGTLGTTLVPFRLEADESAAIFLLPQEDWIEPDEPFEFHLYWSLDIPVWRDISSVYVRFGESLGFHSVPLFYPALAPYQPGSLAGASTWWMDEGPPQGDVGFHQASFFAVSLYMPAGYPPITSGILQAEQGMTHACPHQVPWMACTPAQQAGCMERLGARACRPQSLVRYEFVSGPIREFTLITHPDYQRTDFDVNGVLVTSYWVPDYTDSGTEALNYAVAALRIFTEEFGPYPYPALTVAMAPLANGSMEYPLLNLIGLQLYRDFAPNLEAQIAFAVAHQWWYQMVHNDPVNEPWLDEALSTYAISLYQERLHGERDAEIYRVQEWETPVAYIKSNDWDAPVSLRVQDYATVRDYEILVYRKGAIFFHRLREAMGARDFRILLTEIVANHRFGLLDSRILLDHLWQADPATMLLYQNEFLDADLRR